ncbi:polysaccharide biosynthesis protein [Alkalihalophilus marmarensis]|uniref:putative polysaccharide biosynthesis protein n=1 Tax=Alkalihalophilus marmarensis TaxID=521377 RepID=UPI002040CD3A|nr:polysaccharide biosynthesis protein [Alkalihalophilus marmarensis]MCM3490016.1 polysaccharide biosynthesis protein [Alkalihalophilus marmarensis]
MSTNTNLIRGTLTLTIATFVSKLLGLIYIIPFTSIVGQEGIALYGFGFIPYTVLLSLSTLGIPMAVSKFISKYQALGDYETGFRLFKTGLILMLINGIIVFILLYFLAPRLASLIINDPRQLQGNSLEDVIFTIRMVSFALIIVPAMSMVRGFFQGQHLMTPTAVSQVIEQIVRIIFILSAAYIVIYYFKGNVGHAVGLATFGAFVGAFGGIITLIYYWIKSRQNFLIKVRENKGTSNLNIIKMYKELISYALPLSFIGLAIPLFQLIDLFTVNNILVSSGHANQNDAMIFFGIFTQTAHKIVLIPLALSTAFSITLLPLITHHYIREEKGELIEKVNKTYQVILFFTLPAAIGMTVLSYPIFGAFYGLDSIVVGGEVLRYYGPMVILYSFFSVSAAILQGLNKQKYAIYALLIGLLFKLVLNNLLMHSLGEIGSIIATYIGYAMAILIIMIAIKKEIKLSLSKVLIQNKLIIIFSTIMAVTLTVYYYLFQQYFVLDSWSNLLLCTIVGVVLGGVIYIILCQRFSVIEQVVGKRKFLRKRS